MKVIAISGSPRIGGNSDVLCDQFLKGAKEAGCETEKVNLAKIKLNPCLACYACGKTGKCIQNDGMEETLDKLIQSDVILLATPVYFYSMNAQMKMFIDRCLPRYQEIKDKNFYFAVAAADPVHEAMEPTLSGFRGYTACLPGAKEKGVFYGTGAWEKGDILGLPVMQQVYEAGKNLKNN
ncbi:flavodoxin family protein [Clostridium kluyveri]|uniref:NADPH-dependent FMN reductase n=1 Tax=Clostridium kluyveri TaxID=1534 RepID=A0A1L5F9T8_CLOKL|nr:flavodoxin family protein [Clostridium kluyveri]APM39781.1 NADPH-dependent FMN reductase [Clostridium kluyveri]UZQ50060.1 flavodoxin family protein [Clostridium kluyveri]